MDWTEPFIASYRFMRVSRTTGLETEVLDQFRQTGTISRNQDTTSKESGTAEIVGSLDIGADLVRVYLDATGMESGDEESVVLGTFLPSVSTRDVDGPVSTSSVTFYGRLKEVSDDGFDGPYVVPSGSNAVEAATEIIESCGLEVIADESSYTLTTNQTYGMSEDRADKLSAVNDLLDLAGFSSATTDTMGRVILGNYEDIESRAVEHTFTEGENARFLQTVTDELDTSDVVNVVKVVCSTQDSEVVATATDDDPDSPYSTVSLGRRIVRTEFYDDEMTEEEAQAKAETLLANSQSVIHRVTLEHVYVPELSIRSGVSISYPTGDVSGKFAIRAQDIDLGAGCMVTSECKRNER